MTTTDEHFLAFAALGPDRPGLVAEVTEYVTRRGGNVEDSRMAILGAEFGILLLVSGTAEEVAAIERDTKELGGRTGLTLTVRRTRSAAARTSATSTPAARSAAARARCSCSRPTRSISSTDVAAASTGPHHHTGPCT